MTARPLAPNAERAAITACDAGAHALQRALAAVPAPCVAKAQARSGAQPVDAWHQVIHDPMEKTGNR